MAEIISTKQLESETKYSYCPYCYAKQKNLVTGNVYMKDVLEKLYVVTTVEEIKKEDGTTMKYYDKYWKCKRCDRKLTEKDFYFFYVAKADGTPYFGKRPEEVGRN